jgi:CheY-like chemotaxis protein
VADIPAPPEGPARAGSEDRVRLAALGLRLAAVAHDLGGPLQAIVSQAELLLRDPDRADRMESATRILRSALRCRSVVQDLLAWTHRGPPRAVPVDLHAALLDALELDRYSDAGEVSVRIPEPMERITVLADENRLTRILLNLLKNARQASAGRRGAAIVRVGVDRILGPAGPRARITVEDDGPGVPAELAARIFDPFTTTKAHGSGLGLAVAREFAEEAGGTLRLATIAPEGARFVLELPVYEASLAPGPPARGEPASILVLDDDQEILATYDALLRLEGHRVRTLDRAAEALRVLEEERFDVVLCDLVLPDLPGEEFFHRLRLRDPAQAARVVFATGDVVGERSRRFLEGLPNPVLSKPFQAADLARAIEEARRR